MNQGEYEHLCKSRTKVDDAIYVKFRVTWKPNLRRKRLPRGLAAYFGRVEFHSQGRPEAPLDPKVPVVFEFRTPTGKCVLAQTVHGFQCPLCNIEGERLLRFPSIDALIMHLTCCHSRLRFAVSRSLKANETPIIAIKLARNKSERFDKNRTASAVDSFVYQRNLCFQPSRDIVASWKAQRRVATSAENRVSKEVLEKVCKMRPYYETNAFSVLTPKMIMGGYDADEDVDDSWLKELDAKLLWEFEDVATKDKMLMQKWNDFIHDAFVAKCDRDMPLACAAFARHHGWWVTQQGLRPQFLMHLLNMVRFGMIGEFCFYFFVSMA